MAGMNFMDVANKKLNDVERPPLPPVGTYRWRVSKLPTQTTSKDGKWDILTFPIQALEALEDTDMTDYNGEVSGIVDSIRFMFDKEDEVAFGKTLFRLRNFFEKTLKCAADGDSIRESMNASVNQQFLAPLTWRADPNDAEIMYTQVGTPAPLD